MNSRRAKEYLGIENITGPVITIGGIEGVGFGELAEVRTRAGELRIGRVLEVDGSRVVMNVFEGTQGLSTGETRVRFAGEPMRLPVSIDMLGRVFDGIGRPRDDGPPASGKETYDVNGAAMNPARRAYPRDYIQTGISAIDGMNTLVRGQKLPVFSGSGLPHNELAAQIVMQSTIEETENFAVVFAGMGIKHDDARFFTDAFEDAGVMSHVTMFLNLASDPAEERIVTPRCALTLAEFLAFEEGMHVLVVMTDMTNYCESLREVAAAREEVPSRKGYPGYMYTELASLYERTGRIRGKEGSITQIPMLSMPSMDITHPIPDLTAYITEGQIVLSHELLRNGVYPPIDVSLSLSRLMKDGIGEGRTRADHPNLQSQLYATYDEVRRIKALASIIGEEELSELDKQYLEAGREFEEHFVSQGRQENRPIEKTLDLGWQVLSGLPAAELHRVTEEQIEKYYGMGGL
jgi:V/A-type H+-transporting ATPase subunit B